MSNNNTTKTDNAESVAKKDPARQPFYFNEDGELVIETTRGIYVDGQPNTRMTGIFTCNAKTMAQVMAIITGKPAKLVSSDDGTYMAIEDSKLGKEIAMCHEQTTERLAKLEEERKMVRVQAEELGRSVAECKVCKAYNALPWWKRMFKKIEL